MDDHDVQHATAPAARHADSGIGTPVWLQALDALLQQLWDAALAQDRAGIANHGAAMRHMINVALAAQSGDGERLQDAPAPLGRIGGAPCMAEVLALLRMAYQREPAGLTSYAIGCAAHTIRELAAPPSASISMRGLGAFLSHAVSAHRTGVPVEDLFSAGPADPSGSTARYIDKAVEYHYGAAPAGLPVSMVFSWAPPRRA